MLELSECDIQIKEIMSPPTIVKVDRARNALMEEVILLVQIGVNQAENIRTLAKLVEDGADAVNRVRYDGRILGCTQGGYQRDGLGDICIRGLDRPGGRFRG